MKYFIREQLKSLLAEVSDKRMMLSAIRSPSESGHVTEPTTTTTTDRRVPECPGAFKPLLRPG